MAAPRCLHAAPPKPAAGCGAGVSRAPGSRRGDSRPRDLARGGPEGRLAPAPHFHLSVSRVPKSTRRRYRNQTFCFSSLLSCRLATAGRPGKLSAPHFPSPCHFWTCPGGKSFPQPRGAARWATGFHRPPRRGGAPSRPPVPQGSPVPAGPRCGRRRPSPRRARPRGSSGKLRLPPRLGLDASARSSPRSGPLGRHGACERGAAKAAAPRGTEPTPRLPRPAGSGRSRRGPLLGPALPR